MKQRKYNTYIAIVVIAAFVLSFAALIEPAEAAAINLQAKPIGNNHDIYELSINGEVVIRYRTIPNGYDAVTRSRIIMERFQRFASQGKLSPEYIGTTIVNGLPVVAVGGEVLSTVTILDTEANNTTAEGLVGVWAENIRRAIGGSSQSPSGFQTEVNQEQRAEVRERETTQPQAVQGLHQYESQVINLVNQERAKAGLSPLKANLELSRVARIKSEDMRDNRYFSHDSPNYGSPFDMMRHYGISYRTAAENIAAGQRSPQEVVQAWMNSEGHRRNIMNPNMTEIGVGYVQGGSYGTYWTQMFIGR